MFLSSISLVNWFSASLPVKLTPVRPKIPGAEFHRVFQPCSMIQNPEPWAALDRLIVSGYSEPASTHRTELWANQNSFFPQQSLKKKF